MSVDDVKMEVRRVPDRSGGIGSVDVCACLVTRPKFGWSAREWVPPCKLGRWDLCTSKIMAVPKAVGSATTEDANLSSELGFVIFSND